MKNVYRNQSQETKYIYKSSILKFESTKRWNLSVVILFLWSESHHQILAFHFDKKMVNTSACVRNVYLWIILTEFFVKGEIDGNSLF